MAFELYSDVILTRDIAERGLRAGDVGTLVERHVVPGVAEEGFSVEFFDMTGNTVLSSPSRPAPCANPRRRIARRCAHSPRNCYADALRPQLEGCELSQPDNDSVPSGARLVHPSLLEPERATGGKPPTFAPCNPELRWASARLVLRSA